MVRDKAGVTVEEEEVEGDRKGEGVAVSPLALFKSDTADASCCNSLDRALKLSESSTLRGEEEEDGAVRSLEGEKMIGEVMRQGQGQSDRY